MDWFTQDQHFGPQHLPARQRRSKHAIAAISDKQKAPTYGYRSATAILADRSGSVTMGTTQTSTSASMHRPGVVPVPAAQRCTLRRLADVIGAPLPRSERIPKARRQAQGRLSKEKSPDVMANSISSLWLVPSLCTSLRIAYEATSTLHTFRHIYRLCSGMRDGAGSTAN